MKAIVCHSFGPHDALSLEPVDAAPMGPFGVRIQVEYAGVNFPDIVLVAGKYHWKPSFPFVPGLECAGVVTEVGSQVAHVKAGDRVLATTDPKFITQTGRGSFAEEVMAQASQTYVLPPGISFADAAAMGITYGTSMHALADRGKVQKGEFVLVLGAAGGIGLAAVDIARNYGVRIIAAASNNAKLSLALRYGAHHGVNYGSEDIRARIDEITEGHGVDVVVDPVGGDLFDKILKSMAWEGRLLTVGFAAGRIPCAPANLLLLKGCSVMGVNWGEFARGNPRGNSKNFDTLFSLHSQGKLKPHISAEYGLGNFQQAFDSLVQRQATGKLLIRF